MAVFALLFATTASLIDAFSTTNIPSNYPTVFPTNTDGIGYNYLIENASGLKIMNTSSNLRVSLFGGVSYQGISWSIKFDSTTNSYPFSGLTCTGGNWKQSGKLTLTCDVSGTAPYLDMVEDTYYCIYEVFARGPKFCRYGDYENLYSIIKQETNFGVSDSTGPLLLLSRGVITNFRAEFDATIVDNDGTTTTYTAISDSICQRGILRRLGNWKGVATFTCASTESYSYGEPTLCTFVVAFNGPQFCLHQPTLRPSTIPTFKPTTRYPSGTPTKVPTAAPSRTPTKHPTYVPSKPPTAAPSRGPTKEPTAKPSHVPSAPPSRSPTHAPSATPTKMPTAVPTRKPSPAPSTVPSGRPSLEPTPGANTPTWLPSKMPSFRPTTARPSTGFPSVLPTPAPSAVPSLAPSYKPTYPATLSPTEEPSASPTYPRTPAPTDSPTELPTARPTVHPTALPTFANQPANCQTNHRRAQHQAFCDAKQPAPQLNLTLSSGSSLRSLTLPTTCLVLRGATLTAIQFNSIQFSNTDETQSTNGVSVIICTPFIPSIYVTFPSFQPDYHQPIHVH